jgi:hypothetical protein
MALQYSYLKVHRFWIAAQLYEHVIAAGGPVVAKCGCHDWYEIPEIGEWLVDRAGFKRVREWVSEAGIWRLGNCELSQEELTIRIRAAGGIRCEYALNAMTRLSGGIELKNGVHRWAVAAELEIRAVPVHMVYETESVWAWEP